jgi:hypothetical protein
MSFRSKGLKYFPPKRIKLGCKAKAVPLHAMEALGGEEV